MSRVYISESIRRLVVERANGCCEYCLLHQDDTPLSHPIDHIIAVKHNGDSSVDNLALSCLDCNLHKGTDLTTFDPLTGDLVRLFHPRQQIWDEHFALEEMYIVGLTSCGRATASLLQFNASARLIHRQLLQANGRFPLNR